MKNTLIFLGGAKGVGKTTLTKAIADGGLGVGLYDPGKLFWSYSILRKTITTRGVEKMIAESFLKPSNSVTIINWHYAVWRPKGYIPEIPYYYWPGIVKSGYFRRILFILVTLDPKKLWERRKNDAGKKRKLEMRYISAELKANEAGFLKTITATKSPIVHSAILVNDNLAKTKKEILSLIKAR